MKPEDDFRFIEGKPSLNPPVSLPRLQQFVGVCGRPEYGVQHIDAIDCTGEETTVHLEHSGWVNWSCCKVDREEERVRLAEKIHQVCFTPRN